MKKVIQDCAINRVKIVSQDYFDEVVETSAPVDRFVILELSNMGVENIIIDDDNELILYIVK